MILFLASACPTPSLYRISANQPYTVKDGSNIPANFFTLPCELRNQIYHLLLTSAKPVNPWFMRGHNLEINLIRTNKAIQREAAWVLYGGNIFDFRPGFRLLYEGVGFIDRIGSHNARYIRHIQIDIFPLLYYPSDPRMANAISHDFSKIQSHCSNLKTLVVSQLGFLLLGVVSRDSRDPKIDAAEIIAGFDARARAITSLEEIIVDVPREFEAPCLMKKMEGHGWKFKR
ncbi:hypothetical protein HFD88_002023 [Aspergillus terreus]|nr:hypothetical protein HFD88_002023 [Aspergillus terreus]